MKEILSLKTDLARDDVNIPTHTLETAILLPKNESTAVENPKLPVCEGRDPGDLTTMEDPAALQQVKDTVAK